MVPAPVEQVLDELDEPRVGPVDVLEDQHQRALLGEPLEEAPPGREEILAVGRGPLVRPSSCCRRGSIQSRSSGSGTWASSDGAELRERLVGSPRPRAIPARPRTISASAQYATPSP